MINVVFLPQREDWVELSNLVFYKENLDDIFMSSNCSNLERVITGLANMLENLQPGINFITQTKIHTTSNDDDRDTANLESDLISLSEYCIKGRSVCRAVDFEADATCNP